MNTDRVLLLGATGQLGQALLRELRARDLGVTAVTRQCAPACLVRCEVEIARGDDRDPAQLARWIAGHGLVIDASAPHPLGMPDAQQASTALEQARTRTEALIEATAREGSRLAFVSSFTTLPRPAGALAALEAGLRRALYPYFFVKVEMERMVLAACERGLQAVVVNPTAWLGPWDNRGDEGWVQQVLAGRVPCVSRDVVNVIDVRDVAAALMRALDLCCYGRPIPLSGHNISIAQLVNRLCELARVRAPSLSVDGRSSVLFAFWVESVCTLLGQQTPLVFRAAPLIADAFPMEIGTEQRALGVLPRPLEATLRDVISWHRDARA